MNGYFKASDVIELYKKYRPYLATKVSEFGYALCKLPTYTISQELTVWHDFDKWLKEVAFGEEQYKVLMAEFYKDYGTTLEPGDTYTASETDDLRSKGVKE